MAQRKKRTRASARTRRPRRKQTPAARPMHAAEFPEITDPKKRAYVAALAVSGKFDEAAKAARVSLKTGWNWRHSEDEADKPFKAAVEFARAMACDRIEAEIYRRAVHGTLKPVFQQGGLVGHIREYSDTLLIFQAKALMPKYRDRMEHTGRDGGPIEVASVRASLAGKLARLAGA